MDFLPKILNHEPMKKKKKKRHFYGIHTQYRFHWIYKNLFKETISLNKIFTRSLQSFFYLWNYYETTYLSITIMEGHKYM